MINRVSKERNDVRMGVLSLMSRCEVGPWFAFASPAHELARLAHAQDGQRVMAFVSIGWRIDLITIDLSLHHELLWLNIAL